MNNNNRSNNNKRSYDLFDDDNDNDDDDDVDIANFLKRRPPVENQPALSSSPPPPTFVPRFPTQNNNDRSGQENNINNINNNNNNHLNAQIRHLIHFGTLYNQKVAGITHYRGTINADESVILIREPNNNYDRNAIRVENKSNEQLGYLSRDLAATLTPLIDSGKLWIEGVAVEQKSAFRLLINVKLFGVSKYRETVLETLRSHNLRLNDLCKPGSGEADTVLSNLRPDILPDSQNDAPQITNQQWNAMLHDETEGLADVRQEIIQQLRTPNDDNSIFNGVPKGSNTFKYHISHGERDVGTLPDYDVVIESYSVVSIRRRPQDREHNRVISATNPEKIVALDVNLQDVSEYVSSVNPTIRSAFSGAISFVFNHEERSHFVAMEKLVVCTKKLRGEKRMVSVGIPLRIYERIILCLRAKGYHVNEQVQNGYGWIHGDFSKPIDTVFHGSMSALPGVTIPLGDPIVLAKALKGTALLCNCSIEIRLSSSYIENVSMREAKGGTFGLKCNVDKCFVLDVSHAVPLDF